MTKRIYIYLFLLLSSSFAYANESYNYVTQRRLNFKKSSDYIIKGHEKYEFDACSQFNKEEDDDYYLTCTEEGVKQETTLHRLALDTKAISSVQLRNSFLEIVKESTLEKLQNQKLQIESLLKCLKETQSSEQCSSIKNEMSASTARGLKQMRQLMALSDTSTPYGQKELIYTKNIRHLVGDQRPLPLSQEEIANLDNYNTQFTNAFRQKWLQERSGNNRCIIKVNEREYGFKEGNGPYNCEGYFSNAMEIDRKKEAEKIKESAKNEYYKLATTMPILTSLNLRGDESKDTILEEVLKKTEEIYTQIDRAIAETKDLKNEKLYQLVANKNIMESFLQSNGPSQIICDIAQDYKDDTFYDELKVDLLLAGGAIVGGGVCALTGGLGCLLGVGVVGEGAAIYLSNKRLQEEQGRFITGLNEANQLADRQDDFTLTLIMAPLAVGGEFLGSAITAGRRVARVESRLATHTPSPTQLILNQTTIPNIATKADLLHYYGKFSLTRPADNRAWINLARSNESSLFFDIENSALKRLNDDLADKDLVTALTNLHKEILDSKVKAFMQANPQFSIERYSDFKSVRYALLPKDLSEADKKLITEEFNKFYQETNSEFAKKINDLGVLPEGEKPEAWFQAGVSQSADEAGMAAKEARRISRPSSEIVSFSQIAPEIEIKLKHIQGVQNSLINERNLISKGLVQQIGETDQYTLSAEFIDTIRRVPARPSRSDFTQLRETLKKQYQVDLNEDKLENLFIYVQKLNELTPGLWIEKRTFAHLDDATQGGLTADVTGMGALNIRQVALDIGNSSETVTPSSLLRSIREGEASVTQHFDNIKREFNITMREVLQQRGIAHDIICSGDDCTVAVKEALTLKDQQDIVKAFASNPNPSQFRLSFVPENVLKENRIQIATHGELFEKSIRKTLRGPIIDSEALKNFTLASVMPATKGEGKVRLIFSSVDIGNLTNEQKELIRKESERIIAKINSELSESEKVLYKYELAGIDFI